MGVKLSFSFRCRVPRGYRATPLYLLKNSEKIILKHEIKPLPVRKHVLAMPCVCLCGFELRRPHATCLWCITRKVYYGKMKTGFEAKPYILFIRPMGRVRAVLLKKVLSLAEFIANAGL